MNLRAGKKDRNKAKIENRICQQLFRDLQESVCGSSTDEDASSLETDVDRFSRYLFQGFCSYMLTIFLYSDLHLASAAGWMTGRTADLN